MQCPKCGSLFLYRNEDDDIECLCGYIIYSEDPKLALLDEPESVIEKRIPKKPETKEEKVIRLHGHKWGLRAISNRAALSIPEVENIIKGRPKPDKISAKCLRGYRRSDKGYKRGHYGKVAVKIDEVVRLRNHGWVIRGIARKLNMALNTVVKVLKEQKSQVSDCPKMNLNRT